MPLFDIAQLHYKIVQLKNEVKELKRLSLHDDLTDAYNRRGLMRQLCGRIAEIERVEGEGRFHSMLYIDLDGFKAVNDKAGHLVGDEILHDVADTLTSDVLRRSDVLARVGGDEFVILAEVGNPLGLPTLVERVRTAISGVSVTGKGEKWSVGASIGVKRLELGDTPHSALREADDSMYEDKIIGCI